MNTDGNKAHADVSDGENENKFDITPELEGNVEAEIAAKSDVEQAAEEPANAKRIVDEENMEAVADTLRELKSENAKPVAKKRTPSQIALLVFEIIFFPITLIIMAGQKIFKHFKVGIAVKATIVFTVVFGLMIISYALFILASIGKLAAAGESITAEEMRRLIITSAILVAVFIALGAVIGGLSSQYMVSPVRKITKRMSEISEDNMSARLDPVDSQDELMELTDRINSTFDSLQQAFERQENFVSDASHELKTPLAVIAGYANLLRRWGKDDPKILDEAVEAISRESENMKRIVDQLLWLAKLGKFTLNNTVFNLYETVDDIVDGYSMVNTKHDISVSGDPSITLNTDKNMMTEAVRTLVDNAIKYTPPENGIIKINISRLQDGKVMLTISDNGVGISKSDCEHIFERFYRCDKARSRESGSCGLGLTICKTIVEMMGGTISVDSALGKGSTFKIVLK